MADRHIMEKPDLYVVSRLLDRLWRQNGPMLKTRLQVASNINYDVFKKYLAWMTEHGLVTIQDSDDGHERVVLTQKGEQAYAKLINWINEVIHDRAPT